MVNLRRLVASGMRILRNLQRVVASGVRIWRNLRGIVASGARILCNLRGIVASETRVWRNLRGMVASGTRISRIFTCPTPSTGIQATWFGEGEIDVLGLPPLARSTTSNSRKQKVELSHWKLETATGAGISNLRPTAWWPHKGAGGFLFGQRECDIIMFDSSPRLLYRPKQRQYSCTAFHCQLLSLVPNYIPVSNEIKFEIRNQVFFCQIFSLKFLNQ